jgi:polar amino acid transport system substrate-binding protein
MTMQRGASARIARSVTGLAVAIACVIAAATAGAETVKLANGDWKPFQGKDLPNHGPASQIATEAFAKQGWDVDFKFLPWARGKKMAKRGDLDGTMIYSYTEERAENFIYSDPILELENRVYYNTDSPVEWAKPADLADLTLGGVVDYDYDIQRRNPEAGITFDRVGKPVLNFKKLARGRLDAVVSNRLVGQSLAQAAGVRDRIAMHPKPTTSEPYHLMVSKNVDNADQIVETFNKGLAKLRESGRHAEIIENAMP